MSERARAAPAGAVVELDAGAIAALLFFVSGAASLVLETAAVRAFLELFGSAAASLGAVGGAFLACLALGAWIVGTRADRSAAPLRAYAWLEAIAAAGGLLSLLLLRALEPLADSFARAEAAGEARLLARLGLCVALLLVPVGALGATLPYLARLRAASRSRGLAAGALQAASTLGAMGGALLASLALLPALGTQATWLAGAGASALVAVAAFLLARHERAGAAARSEDSVPPAGAAPRSALELPRVPLVVAAALNGFAVLALEVLLFRGMGQAARGSQDSLGTLLAAWLGAASLGTAIGTLASRRAPARGFVAGHLAAFVAPLVALLLLQVIARAGPLSFWRFGEAALSWGGRLALEFSGALLVAGPAALATAVAFPCACELLPRGNRFGRDVALLSGAWAGGAALAGVLVPQLLLPRLGMKLLLLALSLLPLAALALVAAARGGALVRRQGWLLGGAAAAGALLLATPLTGATRPFEPLFFVHRALGGAGGFVRHWVEAPEANVAVVLRADGAKVLAVNDQLALGGGGESQVETMQGLLPALLHPRPERALALGVGAGITVAALRDAGCAAIDAVELLPAVLSALPFFSAENGALHLDPRVRFHAGDGRSFVRAAEPGSYDLVVGDLFFPWEAGAGQLYAREHFERVKGLLADDGIFCQWVPAHQLRWEEIGSIGRTFCEVFDGATLWLARPEFDLPILGLIAAKGRLEIDALALEKRLAEHPLRPQLERLGVADVRDFLALYVADEWFFREKFDRPDVVTADRPRVEFENARRVESDSVVALHNRMRLFELKEDVVSRMNQSAVEKKRLNELKHELSAASRAMWQLYEAETLLLLADANRALPEGARRNDPEPLEVEAFQLAGALLRDRPRDAPAEELLVRLLLRQVRLRNYQAAADGTAALEAEAAIGPRARFANVRGIAFLLGVCDEGHVKPGQEARALELAAAQFRRAVELDPKLVEARVNLGIALFLLDRREADEEARAVLARAREEIVAPGRAEGRGLPPSAEAIFSCLNGDLEAAKQWLLRSAGQPWTPRIARRISGTTPP